MSRFLALWPIIDDTVPMHDVLDEARQDLPAVARRHGLRVLAHDTPLIQPGHRTPGSGGAALVVTIRADVEPIRAGVAA